MLRANKWLIEYKEIFLFCCPFVDLFAGASKKALIEFEYNYSKIYNLVFVL